MPKPQIYIDTQEEAEIELGEQARERQISYQVPYPEGVVEKTYGKYTKRIELMESRFMRHSRKKYIQAKYVEKKDTACVIYRPCRFSWSHFFPMGIQYHGYR